MNTHTDYQPPASATIRGRQNEPHALRLLIAQRRLYRKVKRWLGLRWIGIVFIGIAAPVVAVAWPMYAVVAGAVSGLWLFIGRTLLLWAQGSLTARAASLQEQFDFYVFQMPDSAHRSSMPTLEEISDLAGPDNLIPATAAKEKLLNWYPIDAKNTGAEAVAIAQRANAAYTDRLLRITAISWALASAGWTLALIVLSVILNLSLPTFLLGVMLPVLPAFLDVVQFVNGVWRSSAERRDLSESIEKRLDEDANPIDGQELLVWQERLFDLRRSAPVIPDLLYKIRRKVNERAMHSAANQLSRRVGGGKQ
jgi:hypothetical protein